MVTQILVSMKVLVNFTAIVSTLPYVATNRISGVIDKRHLAVGFPYVFPRCGVETFTHDNFQGLYSYDMMEFSLNTITYIYV